MPERDFLGIQKIRDEVASIPHQNGSPRARDAVIVRQTSTGSTFTQVEVLISPLSRSMVEIFRASGVEAELSDLQVLLSRQYQISDFAGQGCHWMIDATVNEQGQVSGGFRAERAFAGAITQRAHHWEIILREKSTRI